MEAVIFIGIQASGKSSFFKARFFETHIRLSLDMLKTRHREKLLLNACFAAKQPFVIDNTNPTIAERAKYIQTAKEAGFHIVGYYFQARLDEAIRRNEQREGKAKIPEKGLRGTFSRLQIPSLSEGFNELFYVRIADNKEFIIEDWKDEV